MKDSFSAGSNALAILLDGMGFGDIGRLGSEAGRGPLAEDGTWIT